MTQYTKFTKNLAYNEHYTTVNNSNLKKSPSMHFQSAQKPSSRGGGANVNGSPSMGGGANPTLPKPVLVTNLNSSNISSLIKNERIKSSALARSVTMRYNTNTKHQFENGMRANFTNGIMQPASANQTNHFHYSRKNSGQVSQQQQQSPTAINPQQQLVNDAAAQSKKEYLNLLSNIHRSSSIKINREKSNLSNYFSSLVANKERGLAASSTNLSSTYNQNPNSSSNGHLNQLNQNSSHIKQTFARKTQPFSLRNNNTNIFNSSNNSLSNNNLSNDTNTNAFLYNSNTNLLGSANPYQNKKTSISLDNVFNGIDSIISSNEKEPNRFNLNQKYDLNKSGTALNQNLTPTLSRKMNSTSNLTNYNNINANNNGAANVFRNSGTPTSNTIHENQNEVNPSRMHKKNQLQRLNTEDEMKVESENAIISKELPSSSRLNVNSTINKQQIAEEVNDNKNNVNGGDETNVVEPEQTGIRKIEITTKNDSRQSMRRRNQPRRSDEFYTSSNKLNKYDVMDQLDAQNVLPSGHENMKMYHPKHSLHAYTPAKTLSQNSNYQSGLIQKANGNTIQLTADKTLVEIQQGPASRNGGGVMNGVVGRPLVRTLSVLSHITRDVNDSYAYTNVQQYIEENELMPPDKHQSIKKWVKEVNSNFDDWEKKTIEKHIEDLFL